MPGECFRFDAATEARNLTRPPDGLIEGHFPSLPWYLDDLCLEGFCGRHGAKRLATRLELPVDLGSWQSRHVLLALTRTGGTQTGDLLLGEEALQDALAAIANPPDRIRGEDRTKRYPERARAALDGEDVGSSPGGEQPKFTATVEEDGRRRAMLVKFAQPGAGEAAERWADLLVCEHLALQTLRDAGMDAAFSALIRSETYTFLEVERFDRTPDVLGREGFVSLLALSSAFTGEATLEWGAAAALLQKQGWLTEESVQSMSRMHAFGRLIGNTDMHQGNVGLRLRDSGALPMAPIYDMLPMSLAPSRTGVLRSPVPLATVAPAGAGDLEHLRLAAPLAVDFWERVAGSEQILSASLRSLAAENASGVSIMARRFGG